MSNTEEQLYSNFEINAMLTRQIEQPVLFLSGGECRIMRRIGGALGCCMYLCVQEYDSYATAVQPLLRDVKTITDII